MKRRYWISILLAALVLTVICRRESGMEKRDDSTPRLIVASGKVMGTFWNVKAYSGDSRWEGSRLAMLVQETLDSIDDAMSTYKSESELSRFNRLRSDEWFDISSDLGRVLSLALEISQQTNGAFDVTVGPLVNLWRFGPDKSPLATIPDPSQIDSIRSIVGYTNLELRLRPSPAIRKKTPDLYVDLSAIAKGFAVDRVAEVLADSGLESFMIDVGGEMKCRGLKPARNEEDRHWILGIEKPIVSEHAPSVLHRVVQIDDRSLATSGDYRNYHVAGGVRFSHLIDPRTGRPVEMIPEGASEPRERLGAVSVVVESCARADALATALFVIGPNDGVKLADRLGIPVLFLTRMADGSARPQFREHMSEAFEKELRSSLVTQ